MSCSRIIVLASIFSIVFIPQAHAYLDPGTGAMLLQGLIGGVALVLLYVRGIRNKIALFVRRAIKRIRKAAE